MIKEYIATILVFLASTTILFGATEYDSIQYVVNDRVITKNEIEVRLFELLAVNKIDLKAVKEVAEFRKKVVDSLIEEVLIDIQANKLMIQVSEDQLDDEIENFRKQRKLGQADFEEALERQQVNLSDFRKNYRRQMLRNQVINREVRSKIKIKDEVLKKIHASKNNKIILIHARHILLRLSPDASEEREHSVKKRILELKNEIESGKSFEETATIFSEDPSAKSNHGDLGFFRMQDMRKEFSDAAFALPLGVISDPVRTPFGYHLIEVIEKKEEALESFEKVRNKLYQEEFQKIFVTQYRQYIERLRNNARLIRR